MPGGVPHVEAVVADRPHVTVGQLVLRGWRWWRTESQPHRLSRKVVVEGTVRWMQPDRRASRLLHFSNTEDVIEMGVGQPDRLERDASRVDLDEEPFPLLSRV